MDDCAKFVEREIRRGHKYDAIIMDPPSYGRGPGGEVWKLEDNLWDFVSLCSGVLSDDALFVLINSYTTGLAPSVLSYITDSIFTARRGGSSRAEELGLPVTQSGLVLPCGASAHSEAGWMKGAGKKVIVYRNRPQRPELMYKLFDGIFPTAADVARFLKEFDEMNNHAVV